MSAPGFGSAGLGAPSATPIAPVQQKARLSVYTVMLVLAFLFLCVAVGMLYTELTQYGGFPQWKVATTPG